MVLITPDTWSQFKTTIVAAAEKVVGRKRGSRKERWISHTTWKTIDERKQIKKQLCQGQLTTKIHDELKCEYKVKDKEVKRCCARDKQHWYDSKASEAEEAANKGDHKSLYRIVKELTGQRTQSQQIKMQTEDLQGHMMSCEQMERSLPGRAQLPRTHYNT